MHAYGGAYSREPDGKETRRSIKPEPDIFLHAAQKLGVAPQRCVVVGDGDGDGDGDMMAAQRAGMLGVAVAPELHETRAYHQRAAYLMEKGAAIAVPDWEALAPVLNTLVRSPPLTRAPLGPSL